MQFCASTACGGALLEQPWNAGCQKCTKRLSRCCKSVTGVAKMSRVLQTMQKFEMPLHSWHFLFCAGDSYIFFTLSYFTLLGIGWDSSPIGDILKTERADAKYKLWFWPGSWWIDVSTRCNIMNNFLGNGLTELNKQYYGGDELISGHID